MHILVTYDVSTQSTDGQRRLRRVARVCEDWGQRVQCSVFECKVDPAQYARLKQTLSSIIDPATDSLRFYQLGKDWHGRVEHVGVNASFDPDGPLVI